VKEMGKRYEITTAEKAEIEMARKLNKNKTVDKRLKALLLRAEGKTNNQIGAICEYHPAYVSKIVSTYRTEGLSALTENNYTGNHRNMSFAEEEEFLSEYKSIAEQGQIIEVGAIKAAYEAIVGHTIGGSQIYYLLARHGWRKVMPRSKHPNKASEEEIESSKKLT